MRRIWVLALAAITLGLSGCGYNDMQRGDEQVKSNWSEVLNQYQRRADLVPNLVNTVKGFAAQEQQILVQVTEARSRVGSIQATPALVNDPAAFAKFQEAQAAASQLELAAEAAGVISASRRPAAPVASPWVGRNWWRAARRCGSTRCSPSISLR